MLTDNEIKRLANARCKKWRASGGFANWHICGAKCPGILVNKPDGVCPVVLEKYTPQLLKLVEEFEASNVPIGSLNINKILK